MFDFDKRRQICLDNMKRAYDERLHGNDEQVLDGSWKKLFEENGGGEEPKKKKQKTGQKEEEEA
jgi:cryptochrome